MEICVSSRLRILNGRIFGDLNGKFTSYRCNGNSVIDYCLCTDEQMTNTLYFHVDDPILRLSDHSKISVRLMANFGKICKKKICKVFHSNLNGIIVRQSFLQKALQSDEIHSKLKNVLERQISNIFEVNDVVSDFTHILVSAANKSLRKKTSKKGQVNRNKKWFDLDLMKNEKNIRL